MQVSANGCTLSSLFDVRHVVDLNQRLLALVAASNPVRVHDGTLCVLASLASVSPLPPVTLRSVLPLGNLLGPGLPVILYCGQTFLAERNKHWRGTWFRKGIPCHRGDFASLAYI